MKKTIFILTALLLWSGNSTILCGQPRSLIDPIRADGVVNMQELKPVVKTMHPLAQKSISSGEKPGEFKGVSYRYASHVKALSPKQKNQLSMKQDGILEITGQNAFIPHPDTVYVDPQSELVFQTERVSDNQMLMMRPKLSAVFDNIDIPQQEVGLTLANTVSIVEGVVAAATQTNNIYAVNLRFDSVSFLLDTAREGSLSATLVGQILLTNPRVEGKYSKNGGYQLVFKTRETVDLKVYTTVKAKKEIKKPIWGTEIKAGDLGKCEIGLFLLINMEGEVSLSFEIDQGIDMAIGAKGGTFFYLPTSLNNVSNIDYWCNIDYGVEAKMKAFAGLQCTANLKIKSYNALDLYINGGMEGTVDTDGSILNADIGFRIKSGGKIVSKSFTLMDNYYSLWKVQQPDYRGYYMQIHEACAFGDYVVGEIHTISDNKTIPGKKDTIPYQGNLTVLIRHPNNQINEYPSQTSEKGLFTAVNVVLKNGDKVMVKLPGVSSPSPAIAATIPFREINLYAVDYYAGVALGCIAGAKSEWAALISQQSRGQVPEHIKGVIQSPQASSLKGMISNTEVVKRLDEFRNRLIVYRGPITFETQASSSLQPALATPGTRNAPQEKEKPKLNRGFVDNPLGMFTVSGLVFNPDQKVKARIEVEGFTIESDWVETEGLMVSEIEHDRLLFSSGLRSENLSAENSFVLVSALRGESTPTGSLKILKGSDVAHASITGTQMINEFPEAKKAKLWFNQTVELKPLTGYPGCAIAGTGPWTASFEYSSPGDVLNPAKNRKHPFEMVSFIYKGHDLGYKVFIDQCASCTSPLNVVQKYDSLRKTGIPSMQQKAPVRVETPMVQPRVRPGGIR